MSNRPETTKMLSLSVERLNHKGTCYDLKRIRKARRKDRDRSVQEMLLMMFRSAARDRRKDNGILQMV